MYLSNTFVSSIMQLVIIMKFASIKYDRSKLVLKKKTIYMIDTTPNKRSYNKRKMNENSIISKTTNNFAY